jgi:hypothetical protein
VLREGLEVARVPAPAVHDDHEALGLRARVHEPVSKVELDAVRPLQRAHIRSGGILQGEAQMCVCMWLPLAEEHSPSRVQADLICCCITTGAVMCLLGYYHVMHVCN